MGKKVKRAQWRALLIHDSLARLRVVTMGAHRSNQDSSLAQAAQVTKSSRQILQLLERDHKTQQATGHHLTRNPLFQHLTIQSPLNLQVILARTFQQPKTWEDPTPPLIPFPLLLAFRPCRRAPSLPLVFSSPSPPPPTLGVPLEVQLGEGV